jgi:hypothetical protein
VTRANSNAGGIAGRNNTVWIAPSAREFSCLCETCLDAARVDGLLFAEAIAYARVRGSLSPAATMLVVRCPRGHQLVLRRTPRPPSLPDRDERQLQLV